MTTIETLRHRAQIVSEIRRFFDDHGYLAVETPHLAERPIPEAHIELFETEFLPPEYRNEHPRPLYLLPSPEYYLKQLLASGSGSLYEITHSFRNAESIGPHHNPEFTMLEYYTVDADGDDSLEITRELLLALGITAKPLVITVAEAFDRYAGVDLEAILVRDDVVGDGAAEREERFHHDFLTFVEPELPTDRPVFLTRYPSIVPTLARDIPGTPWADRWELYLGGLETANCFGEETSPERIRSFFAGQRALKESTARVVHPADADYLAGESLLPRCSGVALGVDRLVMHLLGEERIERVISFPLFR
ncbi:MAG: amino acid--tRNA ligase-related protein [Alkalispirochaeta sp.]